MIETFALVAEMNIIHIFMEIAVNLKTWNLKLTLCKMHVVINYIDR